VGGEQRVLELARSGDDSAFGDLVGPYRAELHAHCYRMLGSVHDAEDALQDALLRAWRGLPGFEGRSSVRSWLYTVVTNAALDLARRRPRSELEPYPDRLLGDLLEPSPEARHEQRENLELAFIVALQELPPLQRAVLMLRDVVGFSARETACALVTSVPAVNSALQRARATTRAGQPVRGQQAVLRSLGDERLQALAARYADAMERGDADLLVSMLASDVAYTMPPPPTCLRGHAAIRDFMRDDVAPQRWRHRVTRANGQLAVACYLLDPGRGRYLATAIDVLTLGGDRITAIRAFLTAEQLGQPGRDGSFAAADFAGFGLAAELPA
jgi:RNA polymerase sigma-70 factor, ECF subfamily